MALGRPSSRSPPRSVGTCRTRVLLTKLEDETALGGPDLAEPRALAADRSNGSRPQSARARSLFPQVHRYLETMAVAPAAAGR
jgi:hypothetical protein